MGEGTKLGEKQDNELSLDNINDSDKEGLEATKIGDVSDFEKSLFENEEKAEGAANKSLEKKQTAKQTEKKVADSQEKTQKNELELLLEQEMEKPIFDYQEGDVIEANVRLVEKAGIIIDFNYKSDGYIPNAELGFDDNNEVEKLEIGDTVKVFIEKLETKDGYSLLSRKKAQFEESWDDLIDAYEHKESVNVAIVSKVMGGLVTTYKGIRGFIPASQILLDEGVDMESLVGSSIDAAVIQADRRRRKVIFSNKNKAKSNNSVSEKFIEEIEVGQTKTGKVTSIKDFGVFVDIGGIEGLVHISELSWLRVSHPTDIVAVGDEVTVFILGIDKKHKKISLGMKQLEPDPWVSVGNNYSVGQIVEGTISRIVTFGAFIKLEKQLEGLIHISEMSNERIEKVEDVVKVGDTVKAKIIKLLIEDQKIGLTLKNIDDAGDEDTESEEVTAEANNTVAEEDATSEDSEA